MTYRFDFNRDGVALAVGRMTSVFCRDNGMVGMEALPIPAEIRTKLGAV